MYFTTWLIAGLVAGLAAALVGGIGYGLLVDIAVGMVGAVLGGWLFGALGIRFPVFAGPSAILVAFIGAALLLFLFRALRTRQRRRLA